MAYMVVAAIIVWMHEVLAFVGYVLLAFVGKVLVATMV